MKKPTAALLAAAIVGGALSVAPIIVAPNASAEICAGAHGRFVGVEGCGAPVARGIEAGAAIAAADHPYAPGEIPCYTVEGVAYYTPPGDPC